MLKKIQLEDGERIELRSAGALNVASSGRWRLGEWVKTSKKMLFLQADVVRFEFDIGLLIDVSLCEREYSFGKRPCLKIIKRGPSGNKPFWMVSHNIDVWRQKLSLHLKNVISEEDVIRLAKDMDSESEKLLWFLYRRQHATISELANEINAANHMDALNKIRLEVNPTADKLIGRPIFVFRQSWDGISYSWWLADAAESGEPFHDIIDEGDFYRIIAEAPEDAELVRENGNILLVNENGFKNTVKLPADAKGFCGNSHYRNGILETCLEKGPS